MKLLYLVNINFILCYHFVFINIHIFVFFIRSLALPLAEITWDKDGEIISVDSAFRIDYYSDGRATLYIPETFVDDQGYYTCTAKNSLGSSRTTARLVVKGKCSFSTLRIINRLFFSNK